MSTATITTSSEVIAAPAKIDSGYRRMWQIAWPVSVSTSTVSLFMVANLFWVGYLGTDAIAAVSACGHVTFITFGLTQIVFVGALAIVSRRIGERHMEQAYFAGVHAAMLGGVLGAIVAAVGWFAAPWIVHFFRADAGVERIAVPYLQLTIAGQFPMFIGMAIGGSYSASGDTRTPMILNAIVVGIHTLIDPFFIFARGERFLGGIDIGWLGWGAYGAAVSDMFAALLGLLLFVGVSVGLDRPIARPRHSRFVPQLQLFWQILRIGAPASGSFIARPLSTLLLIPVIASFGTTALAAFGIAFRSFSLNWIPYSGLTSAVSALVGQNLGARDREGAERVVGRGLSISVFLALGFCLLYGFFAADFVSFFDSDPAVVATAVPFVQLIALGFLATGTTIPMVAAMNGAGDTRPPMFVTIVANWPVKLPLCWALALPFGYGTNGVWIGMLVSMVLEAAIIAWWFRRGTWKTRKV